MKSSLKKENWKLIVLTFALFFLSTLPAKAVKCEGECRSSEIDQPNGCAVNPKSTCTIRDGSECTVVKNFSSHSHFIPAKVGKRDWTNFKSKHNKQTFEISECAPVEAIPDAACGASSKNPQDCICESYSLSTGATSKETVKLDHKMMCSMKLGTFGVKLTYKCEWKGCEPQTFGSEAPPEGSLNYCAFITDRDCATESQWRSCSCSGKGLLIEKRCDGSKVRQRSTLSQTCEDFETDPPECTASTWAPNPADTCIGEYVTQTSNCATTRSVQGTKSCACTESSWAPDPADTCSTENVAQTSNCGTTRTVKGTKSCAPEPELCPTSGTCQCTINKSGKIDTEYCGENISKADCNAQVGATLGGGKVTKVMYACPNKPKPDCRCAHPMGWSVAQLTCLEYPNPPKNQFTYTEHKAGDRVTVKSNYCAFGSCYGTLTYECMADGECKYRSYTCQSGQEP